MDYGTAQPDRARHDRYVRRAHLRISAGASGHRLAFLVEEALRLTSPPGEEHGRTYYFRRMRVGGLSQGGNRTEWLARFQETVQRQSQRAVHGAEANAGQAEAVYFRSEAEALEILLHRLLARRASREWFWPMVIGEPCVVGGARTSTVDVLNRLRARPASWVAVAASLFSQPGFHAASLIQSIPRGVFEAWVQEIDTGDSARVDFPLESLARDSWLWRPEVRRALQVFGTENPGMLWLGAMAVLLQSPSDLATGTAVQRVRAGLKALTARPSVPTNAERVHVEAAGSPPLTGELEHTQKLHQGAAHQQGDDSVEGEARGPSPTGPVAEQRAWEAHGMAEEPPGVPAVMEERESVPTAHAGAEPAVDSKGRPAASEQGLTQAVMGFVATSPAVIPGTRTQAGGLFFLLNAMLRIGAPDAISLDLAVPQVFSRVLLRLARHAGVAEEDPVLTWLHSQIDNRAEHALAETLDSSCWPEGFRSSLRIWTVGSMVRLWSVAVRRWCLRFAGVSASEVVRREGLFSVDRTDLDVTLPLETADVRIRLAGLDLDPGWLPWFGLVVRFHYVPRGEIHG